jgi:DNA-binding SARP family transcriptional activator
LQEQLLRLQERLADVEQKHSEKDLQIKNLKHTLHQIQATMMENEDVHMATKAENIRLKVGRLTCSCFD